MLLGSIAGNAQIAPGDTNVAYQVNGALRFSLSQSNEVRQFWLEAYPSPVGRPQLGVWIQTNYPAKACYEWHAREVARYTDRQKAKAATESAEALAAFYAGFAVQTPAAQAAQVSAWKAAAPQ